MICKSNFLHKSKFSVETQWEDTLPLVTENWEFQYRDNTLKIALVELSDCQFSHAGKKPTKFPWRMFCFYNKRLLFETLIEKMKHVGKHETRGWVWKSRVNDNSSSFFGNLGLTESWFNEQNQWSFIPIFLYNSYSLDWKFDGGNLTCSGWDREVWKSGKIKRKSSFWSYWTVRNVMHQSKQVC